LILGFFLDLWRSTDQQSPGMKNQRPVNLPPLAASSGCASVILEK
jgi:hypothetical protein